MISCASRLCDETGHVVDGDDVMAICGLELLAEGALKERTVVATAMSNAGLDAVISQAGGRVVRAGVGDKNVIDEMLRGDYNFGGEQSGHLIFRDYSTTGDGLVSALQILRIMKIKNKPLSELLKCWKRFPQSLTNVMVRKKLPFESVDGLMILMAEAEAELKPQGGRVLLRYSGTEPKARLLLEGPEQTALDRWAARLGEVLRRHRKAIKLNLFRTLCPGFVRDAAQILAGLNA